MYLHAIFKTCTNRILIHIQGLILTIHCIISLSHVYIGGELFDYVVEKGTLSEEEASVIIRKITSAVAHMHGLNIIHRDLKPENLVRIMTHFTLLLTLLPYPLLIICICTQLLTSKGAEAEVKLIDFGLAKEMSDSVARSFLGTRGYLAPEMLQRLSYDKSIDIWVSATEALSIVL